MIRFILTRLGLIIPTFLGMTLLVFLLIRMVPGDPVETLAGERGIDATRHAALLKEYGLDRPVMVQYGIYIGRLLHGDLGRSIITHAPVLDEFKALFPATVELGLCAILFALIVGIPAGILAAVKRNSIFDHGVMGFSLTGYSMPIFWWGLLLILLFSVQLDTSHVEPLRDSAYEAARGLDRRTSHPSLPIESLQASGPERFSRLGCVEFNEASVTFSAGLGCEICADEPSAKRSNAQQHVGSRCLLDVRGRSQVDETDHASLQLLA